MQQATDGRCIKNSDTSGLNVYLLFLVTRKKQLVGNRNVVVNGDIYFTGKMLASCTSQPSRDIFKYFFFDQHIHSWRM